MLIVGVCESEVEALLCRGVGPGLLGTALASDVVHVRQPMEDLLIIFQDFL